MENKEKNIPAFFARNGITSTSAYRKGKLYGD